MILEIGSSFFWKLELGFWNYTFINLLGPMWLKSSLLDPSHWDHAIFWDFIILLDSSYDSGDNDVLFVKIGARFWTCSGSGFIYLLDPRRKIAYYSLLIRLLCVICCIYMQQSSTAAITIISGTSELSPTKEKDAELNR